MDGKVYAFNDRAKAAKGPAGLTGTWYGRFAGGDREDRLLVVVAVERAGRVEAAWRAIWGGTASASGRVEANRLSLKSEAPLEGCRGIISITGTVEGDKVVGSYAIEGCPGIKHPKGTFELKR
jgi:hypothetical protein